MSVQWEIIHSMRRLACAVIVLGIACGGTRVQEHRDARPHGDWVEGAAKRPNAAAQGPSTSVPRGEGLPSPVHTPDGRVPTVSARSGDGPSRGHPGAHEGTTLPTDNAQVPTWPRGETRRAEAIFSKWIATQRVLSDRNLAEFQAVDQSLDRRVRRSVPTAFRRRLLPLLPEAPRGGSAAWREGWRELFREMDSDMSAFVSRFRKAPFSHEATEREDARLGRQVVRDAYYHFFSAFFDGKGARERHMGMHALGTRMFEYCVSEKTHGELLALAQDPRTRPVARLLYLMIWQNVSRMGWRHWHESTLATLKERHDAGDEIVYMAGGVDIFRLLTHGIHRIRLIDPLYPSQSYYYSPGWEFLIRSSAPHGGLGDRILFRSSKLYLQRAKFKEVGTMETGRLSSGTRLTLPLTETVWWVHDESDKRIGTVIIERRRVRQEDFGHAPGRRLLMSFNEMHFLTYEGEKGWGIRPEGFPEGMELHIKQLRRPVSRAILLRLRQTERVFGAVQLGNNVN